MKLTDVPRHLLHIRDTEVICEDDNSKTIVANSILFLNNGQTDCVLDEYITIPPGGSFAERVEGNGILGVTYSINFVTPAGGAPDLLKGQVFAGNRLTVRTIKKAYSSRI